MAVAESVCEFYQEGWLPNENGKKKSHQLMVSKKGLYYLPKMTK